MSTMKAKNVRTYDVLIVGAGPAGASAARGLVKNGYRVLVVEWKKLPRYKICSGLIIDRAQDLLEEYFGRPPQQVFSEPRLLKGARLCLVGDKLSDIPLEKGHAFNVWRSSFDHWLIQQSGADVLDEHQLVGFRQTAEKVQASILRQGKETLEVEASYLIGADGAGSRVRRLLDPAIEKEIRWATFVQLYCHGTINLEREYFYAFFDPSLRGFYNWLDFKDDNLIYGIGARKGESVTPYLENLTEYLKSFFSMQIDEVVRRTGCVATDMGTSGNFVLGRDRVLLVGEAAGFMNAFGEGISSALATGYVAAEAIHQAEISSKAVMPIFSELAKAEQELTTVSWEMFKALVGRGFLDQAIELAQPVPPQRG
jgi:geranylgeranyl reductase family protein